MVLMANAYPAFSPPLADPDFRRLVPIDFTLAYKDVQFFDPSNPHHRRKKASIKSDIHVFFPEFVHWMMALASIVKVADEGVMTPRPAKVTAKIEELIAASGDTVLDDAMVLFLDTVAELVCPTTSQRHGDKPATGPAIEKAWHDFLTVQLARAEKPWMTLQESNVFLRKKLVFTTGTSKKHIKVAGTTISSYYSKSYDAAQPFAGALKLRIVATPAPEALG